MTKKSIALVLAIMMVLPVLFGGFTQPTSVKSSISATVGTEPQTIDPSLNQTVDGAIYIMHVFEGLTRISKNKKTIPGVAYKWDVSKDGLTYTFYLRSSKWSDGKPVKASDFEYSWKRTLDPKTASLYAQQLYYIKGAEDYNTGKGTAANVGVKAVNDKTLKVTLKAPTGYFIDLLRTPSYMPLRKDTIDKNGAKWTQSPKTYIGNGSFVMAKWAHNSEIVLSKSNTYWDKGAVLLKEVRFKLMDDATAALNAYDTKALDLVNSLIPPAEVPNLIKSGKAKAYTNLAVYYIYINNERAPFNDAKVRKALSLAIDRDFIVNKVTQAGQKPAVGVVPYDVPGASKSFREETKSYLKPTAQIAEAKKLLAEAGYPDGKGFPTDVELYYNTQSGHKAIMEAVIEQWKVNLGITIKTPNMEWKVLSEMTDKKDYTMARMGWGGDYNDPMTFLDMFMTDNGQNKLNFSNAEFDKLINTAKNTGDQKIRMDAMRKAEAIFMDQSPAIPIYFYVLTALENPKLKGHIVSPDGFIYFMYAYTTK